ncbi:hypothetical protein [Streptomyces drozdowiczii]|uniref:Uncharacterized protein n=1 Tax=Streptomyces drozdowiczii TaxID=202862 RepID=A0ABY6PLB8_9ACTN|nr:hypothetical protein [Streptomyces drozdowiczii]MCX0247609.1 hypothetical protein [Streptomyces drozdowiczii]UZK53013.1 hypothetical protein NEH16_01745 [Streptomyces drozdowiczii]
MSPGPGDADAPPVDRVETAVCTVPTDAHEGDGTLAWAGTSVRLAVPAPTEGEAP